MGDVKDILGVPREGLPSAAKSKKAEAPKLVKPKGMSRRVGPTAAAAPGVAAGSACGGTWQGNAQAAGALQGKRSAVEHRPPTLLRLRPSRAAGRRLRC